MHLRFLVVAGICLAAFLTSAQERPFPQHLKYPYGVIPAKISDAFVKSEFNRWKNAQVEACNGGYRVKGDPESETRVEAMGFGMLSAAIFGDKVLFDGLLKFYKSKLASGNMMAWKVTCTGINDQGSASDGDVEVAFALIMASYQWPTGSYLTEAKSVINNLKTLIKSCNGTSVLAPGTSNGAAYGGCDYLDLSYHNPAAFRLFAKVSGDNAWTKLADDTYTLLNNSANKTTGLVPDWQTPSGQAGPSGKEGNYKYDACRTPWRIAIDYVWNGNKNAETWLKKLSTWAYGFGIANIKEGFSLSGQATGTSHPLCVVGGFGMAAMANSQAMVDEFTADMIKIRDTYWFTFSLTPLYLALISGNYFRDDITEKRPDVGVETNTVANVKARGLTIRCGRNGMLSVTGLRSGYSVEVTTLAGRMVTRLAGNAGDEVATATTTALKRGCYLVAIIDGAGNALQTRTVTVY